MKRRKQGKQKKKRKKRKERGRKGKRRTEEDRGGTSKDLRGKKRLKGEGKGGR